MRVLDADQKFNEIYDTTYLSCQRFLTRRCANLSDIQDMTQDVYLAVYKSLQKKGLSHIQEPEAFVMTVARNTLNQYYRKHAKDQEMIQHPSETDEDEPMNEMEEGIFDLQMDALVVHRETLEWMWKELKEKPLKVQKAFVLFYYFEETIPMIADSMGENESTVKNWIYRTKNQLMKLYQKEDQKEAEKGR